MLKLVIGMLANSYSKYCDTAHQTDRPRHRQGLSLGRGFSLIEILVVMLIISITVGFAVLAFGDFGKTRKIRTAAEGFAQFVELIHERALLESSTLQVQLTNFGYMAQRLNSNNQWKALNSSYYRQHSLPLKTLISVTNGGSKPDQLNIIMSSAGDMTPFKVYFGTAIQPHLAMVAGGEHGAVLFNDADVH